MTKPTNTPQPAGSLREILESIIRKDDTNGFYSEALKLLQPDVREFVDSTSWAGELHRAAEISLMLAEAETAITALIEGAVPAKVADNIGSSSSDFEHGVHNGFNAGIERYRVNLLRALDGKEQG